MDPSPNDSTETLLYALWRETRTVKLILLWAFVVLPILLAVWSLLAA